MRITSGKMSYLCTEDWDRKSDLSGEIINIGSDNTYSVNRLVELLDGDMVNIPKRPGEPDWRSRLVDRIQMSNSKLQIPSLVRPVVRNNAQEGAMSSDHNPPTPIK